MLTIGSWRRNFTVPLLVATGVALVFGCGSYGLLVGSLDRELESDVRAWV